MTATKIVWTEETWNPTTGCDRVSPGCDNCYAATMARRLKAMGNPKYQRDGDPRTSGPGFGVTEHPDVLAAPLSWRKPRKVFVNSMSDLFHKDISDDFITRAFAVMALAQNHTFQVLTKRHARMRSLLSDDQFSGRVDHLAAGIAHDNDLHCPGSIPWPLPNLWLGVSAEDQKRADLRIPALRGTPAAVRWVSAEPLLGPVSLHRHLPNGWSDREPGICWNPTPPPVPAHLTTPTIDWVVVGAESGPGARPMDLAWAEHLVKQCQAAGVPVLVKQLPTGPHGRATQDIDTFPEPLRVRQYPEGVQ